ncbi:hypothetical protein [Phreatobacter stygius]|uniref:Uncharacterized protein n=1 Tax=Phreatobacter stygius TaxID=1940610 RepID=A0A4D7B0T1_9HYPH|nr:hypothetical protein [Phreatobacter stygius]QCI65085.1 hypothetical protein E8M01_13170 [Phreatobacter stygius]
MRIPALLASAAGLTIALNGAALGQDRARGLGGTTLTTSRIDPDTGGFRGGSSGYGIPGGLIFRDPRFQNVLLPCDDPQALTTVSQRFAEKEGQFWNSALTIAGFDRIRQVSINPWGRNNIPRIYCSARAHLSDGRVRTVDYAIMEDQSIIGYTWGVEWCVRGLDRGWSFAPNCRMARP